MTSPPRWNDDDVLPEHAAGIEGIARQAEGRCGIAPPCWSPRLVQNPAPMPPTRLARAKRSSPPIPSAGCGVANDAVVEIEQAETRPVARRGEHLARAVRRAGRIEFERDVAHAERVEQFAPGELHHVGGVDRRPHRG